MRRLLISLFVLNLTVMSSWLQAGTFDEEAKKQFDTSSRFKPPVGWTGPVFESNQDYPTIEPPTDASLPWLAFDFKKPAEAPLYMKAVLTHAMQNNRHLWDPDRFPTAEPGAEPWFHAPWMHFDSAGREPIHGLTSERPAPIGFLHDLQTEKVQNWAVGFYNKFGGYVFGQTWADTAAPLDAPPRFPVGTVSIKLLFTQATKDQVPYLEDSIEWDAMIFKDFSSTRDSNRSTTPTKLRLLQIDIAIRDPRADDKTGWVFGTFVYNHGNQQPGDTPWDRMLPVGLSWGNDPDLTATSGTMDEGWLNPVAAALLKTTNRPELGLRGRVNGPVDNPRSSCSSCHMTAQAPFAPIMFERRNDERFGGAYSAMLQADWFRNLGPDDPFLSGKQSLDFSLQLAKGLDNFSSWKSGFTPSPPTPTPVAANESVAIESTAEAPVAMQQDVAKEAYVSPVSRGDEDADAPLPQTAPKESDQKKPGSNWPIATTVILVAVLFGAGFLLFQRKS